MDGIVAVSEQPETRTIRSVCLQIKAGIDEALAQGAQCDYPIIFMVGEYCYSFEAVLAEIRADSASGEPNG